MKRSGRSGFTLVEIMVVVIIIGVIAALVLPNLFSRTGQAKVSVAKQKVATLESSIQLFQQDYGRFPESLDELVSPPTDVEGGGAATPPSVKPKDLVDPWGNEFVYRFPGQNWAFDIVSLGADGQEGGEGENADISNYQ